MLCVPVNEDIKPLKMYQMVVLKKKKTSFNHKAGQGNCPAGK